LESRNPQATIDGLQASTKRVHPLRFFLRLSCPPEPLNFSVCLCSLRILSTLLMYEPVFKVLAQVYLLKKLSQILGAVLFVELDPGRLAEMNPDLQDGRSIRKVPHAIMLLELLEPLLCLLYHMFGYLTADLGRELIHEPGCGRRCVLAHVGD